MIAQLVERDLAKVEVEGSNPFHRSKIMIKMKILTIISLSIFLFAATFLGCKPENTPQKVRIEHLGHSIDTNILITLQQQTDTAQFIILQKLTPAELDTFF